MTPHVYPEFVQARCYLASASQQVELCPAAIAEVEKINSWETLSIAKGQLGHVYAAQGKRKEALEIADKLRRRSMQQYKDPFISPGVRTYSDQTRMYLDPAPARQHHRQPQLGSCCFGDFLAANSTGTKRPAEEIGLRLLFQRSFFRWRSSVLKLKPRLWQNSLRRIPLLANSATNC